MQEFLVEIDAVALRDAIVEAIGIAFGHKDSTKGNMPPPIKIKLRETPQELLKIPVDLQKHHSEMPNEKPFILENCQTSTLSGNQKIVAAVRQAYDNNIIPYLESEIEEVREKIQLLQVELDKRLETFNSVVERIKKKHQQP